MFVIYVLSHWTKISRRIKYQQSFTNLPPANTITTGDYCTYEYKYYCITAVIRTCVYSYTDSDISVLQLHNSSPVGFKGGACPNEYMLNC